MLKENIFFILKNVCKMPLPFYLQAAAKSPSTPGSQMAQFLLWEIKNNNNR